MLKTLSKAIPITTIYKTITDNLLKYNDLKFKIRMINILDTFLFIEKEGEEVRKKLRNITNERNEDDFIFFKQIFTLFSIKPISTLMMCIISNYFELSFYLSLELAKMDLKQDDYYQIFQMIQLFESIIFHPIRIKLITPKKNIFLVKTLNALLFILPQGEAFNALKKRLIFVPVIFSLDKEKELIEKGNAVDNYEIDEKKKNDVHLFINIFKEVQDY
jgi:vacuole morphology and inheritance protein 14